MAKEKATITVDRDKLNEARTLIGAASNSAAIDVALGELIRSERIRRDVAAYAAVPPSDDEVALSRTPIDWSDLADDTDWDTVYAESADDA
jgi:hypothetical protein